MEVHNLSNFVGTDSLLKEVGDVVAQAVNEKRDELNAEEIEFVSRLTKRMVIEAKMQVADVAFLLPEEVPIETVSIILKKNGGA